MENEIIIITDHIEIHPAADCAGEANGRWAVVRDGAVYGTYDLDHARLLAAELAEHEEQA